MDAQEQPAGPPTAPPAAPAGAVPAVPPPETQPLRDCFARGIVQGLSSILIVSAIYALTWAPVGYAATRYLAATRRIESGSWSPLGLPPTLSQPPAPTPLEAAMPWLTVLFATCGLVSLVIGIGLLRATRWSWWAAQAWLALAVVAIAGAAGRAMAPEQLLPAAAPLAFLFALSLPASRAQLRAGWAGGPHRTYCNLVVAATVFLMNLSGMTPVIARVFHVSEPEEPSQALALKLVQHFERLRELVPLLLFGLVLALAPLLRWPLGGTWSRRLSGLAVLTGFFLPFAPLVPLAVRCLSGLEKMR